MSYQQLEACHREFVHDPKSEFWRHMTVRSGADLECLLDAIAIEMTSAGCAAKDIQALRLSIDEAVSNSYKHAHQRDWTTPIDVRYHIDSDGALAQVEDRGPGFDPRVIPNATDPENLLRESGRGLFLMYTFASHVCHNAQGNCVCFCKHGRE
jgi:serine/threonine-protein kinase RsbW